MDMSYKSKSKMNSLNQKNTKIEMNPLNQKNTKIEMNPLNQKNTEIYLNEKNTEKIIENISTLEALIIIQNYLLKIPILDLLIQD